VEEKQVRARSLAARSGLIVLLASASFPVLASSSIGLKCDSDAKTIATVDVTPIEAARNEPLTVLKTDADTGDIQATSDLRILKGDTNDAAVRRQAERSAALADALERRRQQRLALPPQPPADTPKVETRLPGVSDAESLLYRREMYRTDI